MGAAPASENPLSPTIESERFELHDALRGFALFGILLVNMIAFGHVMLAAATLPLSCDSTLDRAVAHLLRVRPGPVRNAEHFIRRCACNRELPGQLLREPLVVTTFSFWPRRVAVANAHVWPPAAHDSTAGVDA